MNKVCLENLSEKRKLAGSLGGKANAKNFNKEENKNKAFELHKKGLNQLEIAEILGIHQVTVSSYLRNENQPKRKRRTKEEIEGGKI